ncbi:MAG: succinate dehydrogenase/fumarate reductase cytochrome b subunit [Candidatus Azotimanducaceae bacterium]|jgi:succinate dehydrogenase/fumarate reductase cytochrome b subunit
MDGKKIGASAGIFLILLLLSLQGLSMSSKPSIQELLTLIIEGINKALLPTLFSVALLMFVFNVVRYFIIDINNVQGKEAARRYALYSIMGFVIILSMWGIVNLLVNAFDLGQSQAPCPDYLPEAECARGGALGGFDF